MFGHESYEELKDILDVVVLVNSVEEIKHRLQFVIQDSVAFENQLLDVEEDEGAKG